MVAVYRWPQTWVGQQLWTVEAYVYDSFEIHPWHMSANLSLLYVCSLPYVERRDVVAQSHTYLRVLGVPPRSESGIYKGCGRIIRLRCSSAMLRPLVFVVPKHRHRCISIIRWESDSLGGGLASMTWSLRLKKLFEGGVYSVTIWGVLAWAMAAPSGAELLIVSTVSSPCCKIHSKSVLLHEHYSSIPLGVELMMPFFLMSHHLNQLYLCHLSLIVVMGQLPDSWQQL